MMNKLLWKAKRPINQIASTRAETDKEKTIPTRRNKLFLKYLIAIICIASFYLFEFFPDSSEEYVIAKKEHIAAKKKRTIALNKVKKFSEGSEVYKQYMEEKINTDRAWENLKKVKEKDKVFAFTNIQQFMGEFGPMLGLFIYALINLFRSFYFERKNIGMKFFHGLIISVTMFYFFWMFEYSDFSKATYYVIAFASAGIVVLAVYLITKYQDHYINKLKEVVSRLVAFSFLHTKQEKKPEMLKMFKELSEE